MFADDHDVKEVIMIIFTFFECEICFYLYADVARTTESVYTINRKAADASADRNFNFSNSDNAAWGFTATTSFFIQEIQTY